MRLRYALLLALTASVLAVSSRAQILVGGAGDSLVRAGASNGRCIAYSPDGSMWALVYRGTTAGARQLLLRRSVDGGRNWAGNSAIPVPTGANGSSSLGAIHMDRNCDVLHVVYTVVHPIGAEAYYVTFDTVRRSFGTPQSLAYKPSNTNQSTYAYDVAVTEGGAVVAGLQSHRGPRANWARFQRGSWVAAIRVKKRGASAFGPVTQVNTGSTGVAMNLLAEGEVVHCVYRSALGGYGINYRAFDIERDAFVHAEIPIGPSSNSSITAANISHLVRDSQGGFNVLYPTPGKLRLAWSPAGMHGQNASWTDATVVTDMGFTGGNTSQRFYSVTVSDGGNVFVFYAKPGESLQNLYLRIYFRGQPVSQEVLFRSGGAAGAFSWLCGVRDPGVVATPALVYWGRAGSSGPGRVDLIRVGLGRSMSYGVGCAGSLPSVPRLAPGTTPVIGQKLDVEATGHPASSVGAWLVGSVCAPQPVDLSSAGLTGCELFHNLVLTLSMRTDAQGMVTFSTTTPNNPGLSGLGIHLQSVTIAPGANPAGAVVSNGVAAVF